MALIFEMKENPKDKLWDVYKIEFVNGYNGYVYRLSSSEREMLASVFSNVVNKAKKSYNSADNKISFGGSQEDALMSAYLFDEVIRHIKVNDILNITAKQRFAILASELVSKVAKVNDEKLDRISAQKLKSELAINDDKSFRHIRSGEGTYVKQITDKKPVEKTKEVGKKKIDEKVLSLVKALYDGKHMYSTGDYITMDDVAIENIKKSDIDLPLLTDFASKARRVKSYKTNPYTAKADGMYYVTDDRLNTMINSFIKIVNSGRDIEPLELVSYVKKQPIDVNALIPEEKIQNMLNPLIRSRMIKSNGANVDISSEVWSKLINKRSKLPSEVAKDLSGLNWANTITVKRSTPTLRKYLLNAIEVFMNN